MVTAAGLITVACHHERTAGGPFVAGKPGMGNPAKVASGKAAGSLSDYIARVRKLSESARPIRPEIPVAELTDPALRASLARLAQSKTPEHYWQVGESYRRLGVLDQAYDYLDQAVHLDAGYAPAWDSLARVWRDWGAPEFGLGDALTRGVLRVERGGVQEHVGNSARGARTVPGSSPGVYGGIDVTSPTPRGPSTICASSTCRSINC